MPDYTLEVFRAVNVGGTTGFESAGFITVRDDNNFRDDIFDDIEQASSSETNGDQRIVDTQVTELDNGDTIRTRGLYRMTNNDTGETFDAIHEVFSETAGNPTALLFVFTEEPPAWLFDGTDRTLTLTNSDGTIGYDAIICFASGTLIRLQDNREVRIEQLKVGDQVQTLDGDTQTIRWIGSRKISRSNLLTNSKLRPVRITAGALGCGLPHQDLVVSPQHRVLIRSKIAMRVFSTNEVLIPAIKLVSLPGIDIADDLQEVEYFHFLCDDHQIVYSNGAPTESLYTGPEALKTVSADARAEIQFLFPEICEPAFVPTPARHIPGNGKQLRNLVMRHQKNEKPLLAPA